MLQSNRTLKIRKRSLHVLFHFFLYLFIWLLLGGFFWKCYTSGIILSLSFSVTEGSNVVFLLFFFHLFPCLILACFVFCCLPSCSLSFFLLSNFSFFLAFIHFLSVSLHVVRLSQFKIRFKLQDWLWLSVPSEFLPTRNLAFNGILPCCWT